MKIRSPLICARANQEILQHRPYFLNCLYWLIARAHSEDVRPMSGLVLDRARNFQHRRHS